MKICVYTCITGGYDGLNEIAYKSDELDYLCFTNDKTLKSDTWKIICLDEALDDQLLQRKVKIQYYKYLSGYDASLYIDGKVLVRKDVLAFIHENLKEGVDLVGFKHPHRDCIYDEIYFCVLLNKEKLSTARRVREMLLREGYPRRNGLSDTAIMIRRHTDGMAKLMDAWFHMVESVSRRDQLSFFYCLWKTPSVKAVFLDDNIEDNEYFWIPSRHRAQSSPREKCYLVDFNPKGSYDVSLLAEGKYISEYPTTTLEIVVPENCGGFRIRLDELGNGLTGYSTDPDLRIKPINGVPLDDLYVFYHNSFNLSVAGRLEKGTTVRLKLNIRELSRAELVEYLAQSRLNYRSYKLGCAITWLPRKLRDAVRRLRKHGL